MSAQDILLRQAPHSTEAEQAVLGSMLIDADCVKLVMEKLRPEDFYLAQNKAIFATVYGMFINGKPIDGLTVAEEMKRNGTYDENVTRSYLAQLMEITPTSANVMEYAKIVADKALFRAVGDVTAEITALVQDGTGDARSLLAEAERKIYSIRRGQVKNMKFVREELPAVLEDIGKLSENGGRIPGLSTGLSAIDERIFGLNRSDLILLAARPGMGKTALAAQIALNVALGTESENAVAMFSLEMTTKQMIYRMLSMEARVDNWKLKTGKLSEQDWERIAEAVVTLNAANIAIDDTPGMTVADISAKCRRIENLGLVVIDHMQLMSSGGKYRMGGNRQQEIAEISRTLKIMAKELDVPVLCLSQLSRNNERRDDKRPMLSDLRESGAIEQDADIVMFLYRDDYYHEDSEEPGIAECIVAKNRHGETGKIKLRWAPEYTMFSALEERP